MHCAELTHPDLSAYRRMVDPLSGEPESDKCTWFLWVNLKPQATPALHKTHML
jgi:hypothetical protein